MNKLTIKQWTKTISWAAVFLWMVLIFQFSSQPQEMSNELSKDVTITLLDAMTEIASGADYLSLLLFFLVVGLLGIYVISKRNGLSKRASVIRKLAVVSVFLAAVLLCVLLAAEFIGFNRGVAAILTEAKQNGASNANIDAINRLVRKSAHFLIYFVLGILSINALRRSGISGIASFGLSLAICLLYAASDEFHQTFVPGRGAEVSDLVIDCTGALFGVGVYVVAGAVYKRMIDNKQKVTRYEGV